MPNDRRDTLFEQALALSPSARAAFLAHVCADDEALRADVASLLAAHDAADGFFESLARAAAQPLQQSLGISVWVPMTSRSPSVTCWRTIAWTRGSDVAAWG